MVSQAMKTVDRANFVVDKDDAYQDSPQLSAPEPLLGSWTIDNNDPGQLAAELPSVLLIWSVYAISFAHGLIPGSSSTHMRRNICFRTSNQVPRFWTLAVDLGIWRPFFIVLLNPAARWSG